MHREMELRQRLFTFQADLVKYNDTSSIIAADLTRVFKASQNALINEINLAERKLLELRESFELSK